MPRPFFNIINGGRHADNGLAFQEFMIAPRLGAIQPNIQAASEIYHQLKQTLKKSNYVTSVGDEGGFALVEKLGGVVVESAFIVDLPDIGGSKKLQDNGYNMFCLTEFEGE